MGLAGLILSHSLLILQINSNTIFEDVQMIKVHNKQLTITLLLQMILKWFYDSLYGFIFSKISVGVLLLYL